MDKQHLNWDGACRLAIELADQIKATGEAFDYMVVIPRGGYFVANLVARKLSFGPTDLLHACVGSYDEHEQRDEITVGEMPSADRVNGKRILIIDEVCDTGDTLAFVVDYLNQAGASVVKSGVLHYKPTNSHSGYRPDWSVEETSKWVVYPWEPYESK